MTLTSIRTRTSSRFSEVLVLLNHISSLEKPLPALGTSNEIKILKGLFFVHLYGAFEKTISETIERSIVEIGSNSVKMNHLAMEFQSIASFSEMQSFKECGYRNYFPRSTAVFQNINSGNIANLSENIFNMRLQNCWTGTIDEVMQAFGMVGFTRDARTISMLDSLVEKRNAVSHGRETAAEVGERSSTEHLRNLHAITSQVAADIIDDFESFIANKRYLKPHSKRHYK